MKKHNFNLRNVLAIAICLVAMTMFNSCDKKDGKGNDKNENNNNSGTEQTLEEKVTAAFLQFGVDLEKVKPNVATPYEVTLKYGNEVSTTVYYRKAHWMEKSETDINSEVGHTYNERVFNYIKSIAADGKIYTNKTMSTTPEEIGDYNSYFADVFFITWSYKYNGMWIDVYPDFSGLGDEIGISMNGSGSY